LSSYGVILDIEGCNVALATDPRLEARHAAEVRSGLDPGTVPSGMTIASDPDTGQIDAGGMTLKIKGNIPDLFEAQREAAGGVTTRLDGAISKTATSLSVLDASGLPSSGIVWIGREAIGYSGITLNTLTGLARSALSTRAEEHADTRRVFAFNPTMQGRQVWLTWQDTFNPLKSSALTRYVGFIDRMSESSDGLSIQVVSGQAKLRDQAVFAGAAWFKGRLARSLGASKASIKISLDTKDVLPPGENANIYGRGYIRIEDEVIEVGNWFTPLNSSIPILQAEIDGVAVAGRLEFVAAIPGDLEPGDQVDLMDSTKTTVKATVKVISIDRANGYVFVPAAGYSFAAGDLLVMNYTAIAPFQQVKRGILGGGEAAPHEKGEEITEVRILEGDSIQDILLPCLLSVDGSGAAGPLSGAFDVLPEGWGLGLPEAFVDLDPFLAVVAAGRSQPRYYLCEEDLSLTDLLQWISITHNLAIFWSAAGLLTVNIIEDFYPDSDALYSLSESWRKRGESWTADSSLDRLRNKASIRMDIGIDGNPRSRLIVEVPDAVDLYGSLELEIGDPGIRSAQTEVFLLQVMLGYLRQRTFESSYITYKARLDPNFAYEPGQLVSLVLPNLINHRGSRDIAAIYQIVRVAPADSSGFVELELLYRDTPANLGLVAPCALISGVAGSVLTCYPSTTSLFANPAGRSTATPTYDGDGDEDTDYFLSSDLATIWDESSLGGSVQTANVEILSINYATRQITLTGAPPGWVADGDLIRLRPWTAFKAGAGTVDERVGVYLALADSTLSPPLIGSDAAACPVACPGPGRGC